MHAIRETTSPKSSPEALNENLGKHVKKLRADRGWSLEELATASGVSRSMLSEIEREKANPTLTITFRISSGEDQEVLTKGDSGTYRADVPPRHRQYCQRPRCGVFGRD